MIVSHPRRLVYLCPPKTGSVSVHSALMQEPFCGVLWDNQHAHHGACWVPELSDYFYFITVRNPYERMVSLWKFGLMLATKPADHPEQYCQFWADNFPQHNQHLVSFDSFVEHGSRSRNRYMRQNWRRYMRTVWSCGWHLQQIQKPVGAVLHLETLQQDLSQVTELAGLQVQHLNKGPQRYRPWQSFYTPRLMKRVQSFWPHDFEQFGYSRKLPA